MVQSKFRYAIGIAVVSFLLLSCGTSDPFPVASQAGEVKEIENVGRASYEQSVKDLRTFTHPGSLNTEADFQRMREKIAAEKEPWLSTWENLTLTGLSQLGQKPAPLTELIRGGSGQNFGRVIHELRIAYALALRWKISQDDRYADLTIDYLNSWSSTLIGISGTSDRFLASGLYGYQFAVIGEMMRTYPGWQAQDQQQLKEMLINLFYPMNHRFMTLHNDVCVSHYWANWELANIASMLAIGVFTDDTAMYEEALHYLYHGDGNGALDHLVFYLHPGNMGQYQESGRDQGHSTLGVSLYGAIAKIAWNQGDDLFAYDNYRLLATSEYIAKYNLFEDVPYTAYGPNCKSAPSAQTDISDNSRGKMRPSWALIFNHYQNRLGIAAPWSKAFAEHVSPEGSGEGDELGWTSLTDTLDDYPVGGAPRGLTAYLKGDSVELSWWGAAGAESYQLKRAQTENGPYSVVATVYANEYLTYLDTDVKNGTDYYYQVTAVSSEGESEPSNTVFQAVGTRLKLHLTFNDNFDGVSTSVFTFDGSRDFIELEADIVRDLADFSIAAWVYLDDSTNNTRIFDFGGSDQRYMMLQPRDKNNQTCFKVTKISHHAEEAVCSDPMPTEQWVHVAVTLSDDVATLYLNGQPVASKTGFALAPYQLGTMPQNWLGRSQYESNPFFAGKLDEFRLYSGALSAQQVSELAAVSPDG